MVRSGITTECEDRMLSISPVDQYERGRLKTLPYTSRTRMLLIWIRAKAGSDAAYQRCVFLTRAVRNSRCQSCQVEDRAGNEAKVSVTVGRCKLGKVSAVHRLPRSFGNGRPVFMGSEMNVLPALKHHVFYLRDPDAFTNMR